MALLEFSIFDVNDDQEFKFIVVDKKVIVDNLKFYLPNSNTSEFIYDGKNVNGLDLVWDLVRYFLTP